MKKFIKSLFALNPFSLTFYSIVLVLALFLTGVPFLDLMELRTYDLRFLSRGHQSPSSKVVLAALDEESLNEIGRWPWPRAKIARLVSTLSQEGAKVIGFDIGFFEPDENSNLKLVNQFHQEIGDLQIKSRRLDEFIHESRERADNDQILAKAISDATPAVVLGYFFYMNEEERKAGIGPEEKESQLKRISPSKYPIVIDEDENRKRSPFIKAYVPESNIEILTRAKGISGHFNMLSDQDGILRWIPLMIQCGGDIFPSLSILCAWFYLDRPQLMVKVGVQGVEGVRMGKRFLPTDENGQMLINYLGPSRTFPHFSVSDILHSRFPKESFKDKIVLVGATAVGLSDNRTTPFDLFCPGMEIHATVIDNILSGKFLSRPRWTGIYDLLAIIVLGMLAGIVLPRLNGLMGLLFVSALFIAQILVTRWLFVNTSIWLSIIYPLLVLLVTYTTLTAYSYFSEERERKKIKGAFSRYVSPSVISEILKNPEQLKLGGDERVASVLFCDLAGFTNISERMQPNELVTLLSKYFTEMTDQVFANKGMLKEYVGDELMAIFGAPLDQADHARKACLTALAMHERQQILRQQWAKTGLPPLYARTGINSGLMLVGNMGSVYRFSYGVMGDHVNLASRLEGLNKRYGTEIMISENTANMVEGSFLLRELDLVRVKGKERPVRIYELIGISGAPLPEKKEQSLLSYAAGLEAYRRQSWEEAMDHFHQALASWPEDGPARAMTERCRFYQKMPYQKDWDGVFIERRK